MQLIQVALLYNAHIVFDSSNTEVICTSTILSMQVCLFVSLLLLSCVGTEMSITPSKEPYKVLQKY